MRPKVFMAKAYFLRENPFPVEAIVRWGDPDPRSNGSLYNEDVFKERYEEALVKFIVNPVDTGSKFHFLWSLGAGDEARGFGKTATLNYLARRVNEDFGYEILKTHEFDEEEARANAIVAAMATFDTQRVTTLAGVSLEHVRYLVQEDESETRPLSRIRQRLIERLVADDRRAGSPEEVERLVRETDLAIKGKTLGTADKRFVRLFAQDTLGELEEYVREASPRSGYDMLHAAFVIARAAGIRKVLLLIDQVEDFANSEVPRKRRHMEVERFRDLAVETQPFGEMATYVLTMHPAAANAIDEFWRLARLPEIQVEGRQSERVRVVLRALDTKEQVASLLTPYLDEYRTGTPPHSLCPFSGDAVDEIRRLSRGRPGEILWRANRTIDENATNQVPVITAAEVRAVFAEERPKVGAGGVRRRPFGGVEE